MKDILSRNFVTFAISIGLGLQLLTGRLFDKRIERLFMTGIVVIFLVAVADCADYYLSTLEVLNNLRYVTSITGYMLRISALGIIICISLRKANNYIFLWIPIIIEGIIAISTPFTHIMFYFDSNNVFFRGPLGFLPHIMSVVYMVFFAITTIRIHKIIDKNEVVTIAYIITICSIATFLESFKGYKFLLPGAMMSSCVIYYVYLYVQIYKVDVMTGLLNRRSFYTDVQKMLSNQIAVVSIDLNDLKTINDTQGHAAGDTALCFLADILIEAGEKKFRAYRVGGDEFMVLGINQTLEEARAFVSKVKAKLEESEYTAAFGCAMYNCGDDFDEVCVKSDVEMYKDKKVFKDRADIASN